MNDVTTVNDDILALQKCRARRCKIQREVGDLFGLAYPARRNILLDPLAGLFRRSGQDGPGGDRARTDRIDNDIFSPEFLRH